MHHLKNISAQELSLDTSKFVLIDIRREGEWIQTGIIKDSQLLTFFDDYGNHDLEKWLGDFKKIVKNKEKKFVLICAHAHRTKTVGEYLAQNLEYEEAYHLEGGIAFWYSSKLELLKP